MNMGEIRVPIGEEPCVAGLPDQRSSSRLTLLLRTAKLIGADREYLCILRDVSARGMKARVFHPVPPGSRWTLELGNGDRYPLEAVWHEGDLAGFRLADGPVEIERLVEEASHYPRRQLRLTVNLPVFLSAGAQAPRSAVLANISLQGARLETVPRLALGQRVALGAPGLPALGGTVCWRRGAAHGLVFARGFRLDELARLVAALSPAA